MEADYRVQLDLFRGPLDLLLYLVRRNEVEITDLPLSTITRQFQEFLSVLQFIDIDTAGEFVAMASTLVEIKSRSVLPAEPDPDAASADAPMADAGSRSDLIRRLLEYKKFKEAAAELDNRAAEWQERYPRISDERPSTGKDFASDLIKDVELWDLISALGRILKLKDDHDETRIRYDDTPISVYTEQIGALVRERQEVRFSELFGDEPLRSRIVGMFLAVLELLRHHGYRATQPEAYGEIWIYPPDGHEPSASSAGDNQSAENSH